MLHHHQHDVLSLLNIVPECVYIAGALHSTFIPLLLENISLLLIRSYFKGSHDDEDISAQLSSPAHTLIEKLSTFIFQFHKNFPEFFPCLLFHSRLGLCLCKKNQHLLKNSFMIFNWLKVSTRLKRFGS